MTPATVEELHLLGLSPLADFVDRAVRLTVGGNRSMEPALIAQWRAAAVHRRALAVSEAGLADTARPTEPPAAMRPWFDRLLALPRFEAAFGSLPVALAMVELDTLVVYQHHVSLTHAARFVADAQGRDLNDPPTLLSLCLPLDEPAPEVQLLQTGPGRFVIQSPVADLRAYDPHWLPAAALGGLQACGGQVAAGIAIPVGLGASALNVVRLGQRLVLNNGYHRAYALRRAGVTHVPCVVQLVTHPDELSFAGADGAVEDHAALFESPRPALFKDFFDPALTTVLTMPATRRQIQVSVSVERVRVPG